MMNRVQILCFFLIGIILGGCFRDNDSDKELSGIPDYVALTIEGDFPDYGKDSLSPVIYQTYQWFDLSKLEGVGKAIDTPFVYLRRYYDMIIVRPSDDIDNPYILKNYGLYWHYKWMCDDRGDSILVDRFVCSKLIFEYIQRLTADGSIKQELTLIDTFNSISQPGSNSNDVWDVKKYDLGKSEKFDYNAGVHFFELLKLKDNLYPQNQNIELSDSIKIKYVRSTTLRVFLEGQGRRASVYEFLGEKSKTRYGEAPMGLFDERRDIQRPYFIRRIK